MNGEAAPVLEVVSLTKRYADQPAIADVELSVRPGEVLGLIGPNGAGKTTLAGVRLQAFCRSIPARMIWRGRPLSTQQRREAMFYLPDGIRPYADQFVVEVLAFFAGTYRRTRARACRYRREPSGSARCWPSALQPCPRATIAA